MEELSRALIELGDTNLKLLATLKKAIDVAVEQQKAILGVSKSGVGIKEELDKVNSYIEKSGKRGDGK